MDVRTALGVKPWLPELLGFPGPLAELASAGFDARRSIQVLHPHRVFEPRLLSEGLVRSTLVVVASPVLDLNRLGFSEAPFLEKMERWDARTGLRERFVSVRSDRSATTAASETRAILPRKFQ